MKTRTLAALGVIASLTACMQPPTPEQKRTLLESRLKMAKIDQSDWIMVGAEGFKRPVDVIRVSPNRAVVVPVAGKLRYVDIEEAARLATGCLARATPEVYAAAKNDPTLLLSQEKMRMFDYRLPVNLTC